MPVVLELPQSSPYGQPQGSRRWHGMLVSVLCLAVGAGGYAAYQQRGQWWPRAWAAVRRAPPAPAAPLSAGLSAIDSGGQLQIRWDRDTPAVRSGADALLTITDGDRGTQTIRLD